MKGTCTSCDIHYTYDGFTIGGKSYRLTEERPYMMVTNRCVQRPFLRLQGTHRAEHTKGGL